jgi:transcriptional regulator with XRE-family HTH domain
MPGRRDPAETGTDIADLFFWNAVLGGYLRGTRLRNGLSLRDLERKSGVSDSEIFNIESGDQECRLSSLVKLCAALGVPTGIVLDQVVSSNFMHFWEHVSQDVALSRLTRRWLRRNPMVDHGIETQLAIFCSVVADLLRCSNAFKKAHSFTYPKDGDELRKAFEDFARRLDSLDDPLGRSSILTALNKEPVRELEIQRVLCIEFLDSLVEELNQVTQTPRPRRSNLRVAYNDRWQAAFWKPLAPLQSAFAPEIKMLDLTHYQPLVDLQVSRKTDSWTGLRQRILAATRNRGDSANLARKFRVSPQAVAKWLSGASAPTAETTLRLLEWVTAEEAKQKKGAGSVSEARPARKTQTRKSKHEKPSSERKKK